MVFTYIQLNDYDYAGSHFPYHFNGMFSDGRTQFPVIQPLLGEVKLVTEADSIVKADDNFLAAYNLKKLPGDVIVNL